LSAERLKQGYDLAPPRVQQYLKAEIDFVRAQIPAHAILLALGCGYGRVLQQLFPYVKTLVGIDTARENLLLAQTWLRCKPECILIQTDAGQLPFPRHCFDQVICIQNGISAFKIEPLQLLRKSLRVMQPGGRVLFSSYAPGFWDTRLEWFRQQATYGLIGAIDEIRTGQGVIVCQDGFRATTFTTTDFKKLASHFGLTPIIIEVDGSSVFCEIQSPRGMDV
ncbi:class I SAM-dependent methyltransferase, partial [candidate division KSB1 bacterium]|nr:class I SAM-dependent methyltransferase [candidate division KSB1 bacterium]